VAGWEVLAIAYDVVKMERQFIWNKKDPEPVLGDEFRHRGGHLRLGDQDYDGENSDEELVQAETTEDDNTDGEK